MKYVFIINSYARLVAFSGTDDNTEMSEERFTELIEDLLFTLGSRKHYEDLFGSMQFVHIRHTRMDTFLFSFESDKMLCVCLEPLQHDETEFLSKLQNMFPQIYRQARNKSSRVSESKNSKNGFAVNNTDF